jgi:deoxyribodipyrimidine photo-lyase
VFGKVRYMSAGGLKRKTRPEQYVQKVEHLIEENRAEGPV